MMRHRLLIAVFLTAWSFSAEAQITPPLGNPNAVPAGITPSSQQPAFISQTNEDLQAQAQGNYPPMQRDPTAPLGAIQESWNKPEPSSGQIAPGIVRYVWRPDYVMAVRTREFMTTTLELPQWENVSEIILGDTTIFEAQPIRGKPYIIAIRPLHAGADTNMTVIGTSGNIYNFYLRSEGWNSKSITDFTVYIMANPEAYTAANGGAPGSGQPINALTGQPFPNNTNAVQQQPMYGAVNGSFMGVNTGRGNAPDYIRSIAFDPANLRFDMKIYAPSPEDIEIAPLRAFTDGIWTYFDYGEKAETVRRPVVFRVVDGVDSMVNTRTAGPNGNIIIAEAVGNFTLRNGDRVVCVYQAGAPRTFEGSRGMPPSVPSNDPSLFFNARPVGEAAPGLGEQYGMPQGGVNRQPNFAQGNAGRIPGSQQVAGPIIPQQMQQPQQQAQLNQQFQAPFSQQTPQATTQPQQQARNYSQAYGWSYGGSIIGGPPSIGGPQPFAQQQQWPQYSMPTPGYAPPPPSQQPQAPAFSQPQAYPPLQSYTPPQSYPIPQRLPGGGYSSNDYQRALQPLRSTGGVPTVQVNPQGSSFGVLSRQPTNTMGSTAYIPQPVPQQPTPWSGQPAQNDNAGWMK